MKLDRLKVALHEANDVIFKYNEKNCGVFPSLIKGKMQYMLCYGDSDFSADSVDIALSYPLFDGKSLSQICEPVEIDLQ